MFNKDTERERGFYSWPLRVQGMKKTPNIRPKGVVVEVNVVIYWDVRTADTETKQEQLKQE